MSTQQSGRFPLSDAAYDLIVIMHQKSKALEAYERYLSDVRDDNQLRDALIQIRLDEHKHLDMLKSHLPRLLMGEESEKSMGS